MKTIILLLVCLALTRAAIDSHLVTGLDKETGYTKPWYSGYLDVNTSDNSFKSHYFFFPSQNDPINDPVLLWLNGGPGCSSLLGATQENGPWMFKENSKEIELNEWSWNKKANVIYLESPPGVGFSTTTKYSWNDETTSEINLASLLAFFKGYKEYQHNEFYISGESYAGIYIPTLAEQILKHNKQVEKKEQINFKGFIIGNGCADPLECQFNALINPFMYQVFATQGFFSPSQIEKFNKDCGGWENPDVEKLNSLACFSTGEGQLLGADTGVNVYNLIGTCYHQDIPTQGQMTWRDEIRQKYINMVRNNPSLLEGTGVDLEQIEELIATHHSNDSNALPACVDGIGPMTFFNTESVKEALHVDTDIKWEMCSTRVSATYGRSTTGTYDLYPGLIEAGLRVWIYSGDVDGAVPTAGTLFWIGKLNKQENYATVDGWRSWYTEGAEYGPQPGNRQNAGQYWQSEGLTLVTFKGCGHMVPADNHVGAYDMINAFFAGEALPKK